MFLQSPREALVTITVVMTHCINTLILFSRSLFQFPWTVFTVYRALLFENYVDDNIYILEMLDNLSSSLSVSFRTLKQIPNNTGRTRLQDN